MGGDLLRRATWVTALLLTGLIAAVVEATVAFTQKSPSPASGRPAQTAAIKEFSQRLDETQVRATTKAQWATIARDNSIVVLNSWDFRLIPVLKRANPEVRVWVYKDLSGVRSDDCTTPSGNCGNCAPGVADKSYLSSGMGYCWVKRNHPGWLLGSAATGQPLSFNGYPEIWETDYGNRAYQRQWVRNVLADVRSHGWDGIKVDNALTTADAYGVSAKYPADAAVQAATYSALQEIGSSFHEAGVASVFNVGYATMFPGLWKRWLTSVDGLEQQSYLSYSTQPNVVGAAWETYEDEVSSCATLHKSCWFHVGDDSTAVSSRTVQYGLASYLLATDGHQFLAVGATTPALTGSWLTLGGRQSIRFQMGTAWLRYFTNGVVVVNPSLTTSVVTLGGTYLDSPSHPVHTITLGPGSGAVLRTAPASRPGTG